MSKTFTLPKNLHTEMAALTENGPSELLCESQLTELLREQYEGANFSPDRSVVERVLAYSRAVDVKPSSTLTDDHIIVLN